jgi:hypothetical protein
VPDGSGGGIPGNGGCAGLAFWRFFPGRGLAKRQLNHPARRISLRSASAFLTSILTTDHDDRRVHCTIRGESGHRATCVAEVITASVMVAPTRIDEPGRDPLVP